MENDPIERAFIRAMEQRRRRAEEDFGHKYFQITLPEKVNAPTAGLVLQFIGGPLNNTQRFVARRDYSLLRERLPYSFFIAPQPVSVQGVLPDSTINCEFYSYIPTFIPLSETPFSDDQVVILLYAG